MSKKNDMPSIQSIALKELVIDPTLSGRSEKEIKLNAKSLAPALESFGSWDASQPGAFFTRNGKPHLVRGFTRVAAAQIAGLKVGYFVELPDKPETLRTEAIRSNMGRPISAYEQGRIYTQMRDGTDLTKPVPVGTPIMEPMTTKAIADEVGYTEQRIKDCIAIFEETPEIAALIEAGAVSSNVVTKAQVVKADGKRLDFIKAAIAEAKKEGKETATPKHLDAVRERFVEAKPKKDGPAQKPATSPAKDNGATEPEKPAGEPTVSGKQPSAPMPASTADISRPKKKAATLAEVFIPIFDVWASKFDIACEDGELSMLITAMEKAGIEVAS